MRLARERTGTNKENVGQAQVLVDALSFSKSSVRTLALRSLANLSGDDFGYKAETNPAGQKDALGKWKEWLDRNSKAVADREEQASHENSVRQNAEALRALGRVSDEDSLAKAEMLLGAMSDPEEAIRRRAFEAMSALSGQNFGYAPGNSAEARMESLREWRKWFEGVQGEIARQKQVAATAQRVSASGPAGTAAEVDEISLLIEAMLDSSSSLSQTAFEALRKYGEKNDPNAPAEAGQAWRAWFENSLRPVKDREESVSARIRSQAGQIGKRISHLRGWRAAEGVVRVLEDPSRPLKAAAIQVLQPLVGNAMGFDPAQGAEKNAAAVRDWTQWLEEQKRLLTREASQRVASAPRASVQDHVDDLSLLIESLTSEDLFLRTLAFEALSSYARIHAAGQVPDNFGYAPHGAPESRQAAAQRWGEWLERSVRPFVEQN